VVLSFRIHYNAVMAKVQVDTTLDDLEFNSSAMIIVSADDGVHYFADSDEDINYALSLSEADAKDSIIHIAQGTYQGDFYYSGGGIIDYVDEGLTLLGGYDSSFTSRSTDPSLTIFDGENSPSSISIEAPYNTSDILIEGFTFQNNDAAGFDLSGASLAINTVGGTITVNNNIIQNNSMDGVGGAVAITSYSNSEQSVVFINNTLSNNTQIQSANSGIFGDGGGGLNIYRSKDVLIENNTFEGNTAGGSGGAFWSRDGANFIIKDNTFEGNTSAANGGAMYVLVNRGSVTLEGNTIINNDAYQSGGVHLLSLTGDIRVIDNTISNNAASSAYGAIYSETTSGAGSEQVYSGNVIDDNSSHRGSGAIYVTASSDNKIQINNNLIVDNSLDSPSEIYDNFGGGLYVYYHFGAELELTNNTIVNNHADGIGGGIHINNRRGGSEWDISNNIIYGNTSNDEYIGNIGSDISIGADLEDFNLNLESNVFDTSLPGFGIHSGGNVVATDFDSFGRVDYEIPESNLDNVDPLFVDAANGDYRLSSNSPLIDQGYDSGNLESFDLDGYPRESGDAVEIGAYEYQINSIITGTNTNDLLQGTSGIDYIYTFEGVDAVSALASNDTITLTADGVYGTKYSAKNVSNDNSVGTNEIISLEGLNLFNDVIDGGDDVDTLILTSSPSSVGADDAFFIDDVYAEHHSSLTLSSTTQGIDSTARIVSLETINAGNGNDIVDLTSTNFILSHAVTINGEAGNDTLWGSNGDDVINGGEGNDTIFGGAGSDTLTGGAGDDIFQFTATAGSDVISDFDVNGDSIKLYYRATDKHTNADLNLTNGLLTWGVDNTSNVLIDISAYTTSSDLIDVSSLISFVEIV
jgi:hypothetical protein